MSSTGHSAAIRVWWRWLRCICVGKNNLSFCSGAGSFSLLRENCTQLSLTLQNPRADGCSCSPSKMGLASWNTTTGKHKPRGRGGGEEQHSHCCTSSAKQGDKVKEPILYLAYSGVVTPAQWVLQVSVHEGTCQTLRKESCESLSSPCTCELPLPVLPSVSPPADRFPTSGGSLCLSLPTDIKLKLTGQTPREGVSAGLVTA